MPKRSIRQRLGQRGWPRWCAWGVTAALGAWLLTLAVLPGEPIGNQALWERWWAHGRRTGMMVLGVSLALAMVLTLAAWIKPGRQRLGVVMAWAVTIFAAWLLMPVKSAVSLRVLWWWVTRQLPD